MFSHARRLFVRRLVILGNVLMHRVQNKYRRIGGRCAKRANMLKFRSFRLIFRSRLKVGTSRSRSRSRSRFSQVLRALSRSYICTRGGGGRGRPMSRDDTEKEDNWHIHLWAHHSRDETTSSYGSHGNRSGHPGNARVATRK